jgi:glycerol-3-phosphate O-acyltransferase
MPSNPEKGKAEAWKKAHAYIYEIAADYSHPVVRSASFLPHHGVEPHLPRRAVHHLDTLKQNAPGH